VKTEILYRPSYSMALVTLESGEAVRAEGGAMVSMSSGVTLETKAQGGILKSLTRSLLGGESFFMNVFRAPAQGGTITLAPALPGDMTLLDMDGERGLMVQSGSYVASDTEIEVDTQWGGSKTFFAREGLFLLRCSGVGQLVLSSYGAIHELMLSTGEQYTVDTGHLVAFDEGIDFTTRAVGGLKSTLFSGEGLVVDLVGPGRVLLQTRSTDALLTWLMPEVQRRVPKSN